MWIEIGTLYLLCFGAPLGLFAVGYIFGRLGL